MTTNAEMLKRACQILPGNSLGSFYLPEGHEFVVGRGILTNLAAKLYISLAHSTADIDHMLEAVEDTLTAMRARS